MVLESATLKEDAHVDSSMKPDVLDQHFRESRGENPLKINQTTTNIVENANENSEQTSELGQVPSSFSECV